MQALETVFSGLEENYLASHLDQMFQEQGTLFLLLKKAQVAIHFGLDKKHLTISL
jgi:hypothetical protein